MGGRGVTEARSVLVVTGIGGWVDGVPQTEKIETHIHPLADAVDQVDLVSPGPTTDREDITFHQISKSRWQFLTLLKQFLLAVRLATTGKYDLIVSYALVPYGLFALVCGQVSRTPAHLGIIGMDLDVHAEEWYGPVIRWLFRRFDIISVAGEVYRQRLIEYGVRPSNIVILYHPVSAEFFTTERAPDPEYDLLWLTRLSPVKDPLLFVEILEELRNRSLSVTAAIVGTGPLESEVERALDQRGLSESVALPGWTNEPVEYYRNASVYVMTSRREMLPLSLVEAMYVGVPSVVPALGAIPDIVEDGKSGFVVEDRTVEAYTDRIEELLRSESVRTTMGDNATAIYSKTSQRAVANTWSEILDGLDTADGNQLPTATAAPQSTDSHGGQTEDVEITGDR